MHRWLQRQVLKGELNNPELTGLKNAVADVTAAVSQATGTTDDVRADLNRALDQAVVALVKGISAGQ
jgi:hypothetical protein